MASWGWLDSILALLAAAALYGLYRVSTHPPRVARAGSAEPGKLAYFFRTYYPKAVRQAGFDAASIRFSLAVKLLLGAFLALLTLELGGRESPVLLLVMAPLLGFLLPDLWLFHVRRRRRRQVRAALSFFLDLLVALLHSGMGLEAAFRKAGRGLRFGRSHPLADEVELVALELDLGKNRSAAFEALADRTGVAELRGIAAALRIGLRLGVSVEATLAAQAEALRLKWREEALRQINRAAVQALVPTILCGFPILVLLVFFPAVLEIMEALNLLRSAFQ